MHILFIILFYQHSTLDGENPKIKSSNLYIKRKKTGV